MVEELISGLAKHLLANADVGTVTASTLMSLPGFVVLTLLAKKSNTNVSKLMDDITLLRFELDELKRDITLTKMKNDIHDDLVKERLFHLSARQRDIS